MGSLNLKGISHVQFNGPEAEAARERMNRRIEECKSMMGDQYLLHPSNHIQPLEHSSKSWTKSLNLIANTVLRQV